MLGGQTLLVSTVVSSLKSEDQNVREPPRM